MTAPHDVRRSGNLITVTLRGSCQSVTQLAETALGRDEELEQTYTAPPTYGYRAVRR